jgi:hypothetical protein
MSQMKKKSLKNFGSFSKKKGSLPSGHETCFFFVNRNIQADAFSFFIYDE